MFGGGKETRKGRVEGEQDLRRELEELEMDENVNRLRETRGP